MADPIEPQQLLDQAWAIALIEEPEADSSGTDFAKVFAGIRSGVREPLTSADYRRAISSAYYGLFHAITLASVSLFAPDDSSHYELVRQVRHRDVHEVTGWVMGSATKALEGCVALLGENERVRTISGAFQRLHTARRDADYNHAASFKQSDVYEFVRIAQHAVDVLPDAWIFDEILPDGGEDRGEQLPEGPRRRAAFAASPAGRLFLGLIALRARGGGGG